MKFLYYFIGFLFFSSGCVEAMSKLQNTTKKPVKIIFQRINSEGILQTIGSEKLESDKTLEIPTFIKDHTIEYVLVKAKRDKGLVVRTFAKKNIIAGEKYAVMDDDIRGVALQLLGTLSS